MKKTVAAIVVCTLLGGASAVYAQSTNAAGSAGSGATDSTDMISGRTSATESKSNNAPGTMAGTPVHSIPSNALPGDANADQNGK